MDETPFAKQIHSFYSISIPFNSLVLCDIDDTVLVFPNSWKKFFKENYEYYKVLYKLLGDEEQNIYKSIISDWNLYCECTKPSISDRDGFTYLLEKIKKTNSQFYFVTARNEQSRETTIRDLQKAGVPSEYFEIYFTNRQEKGYYIKNNINLLNYDHIIFIDDNDAHLKSVKKEIPNVICYKFVAN